jgi:regulatory protein
MREITSIEVQKNDNKRANLYLDDKFFSGISIELCVKHSLKKGMEIDENFLNSLIVEDEKGKALDKAVNYISSNLKTTRQIREYLKKKNYNPQTVDYVIGKMQEYKYLDDESYARAFVSTYSNKYGKMKLMSALKSKGISDNIIDEVFDSDLELEDSLPKVAEKYLKNKERTKETFIKLSRFLYSRGYDFRAV